jgi:hypothetical protein
MPDYPSLSALGGALRDYWNRAGSFPMTTSTGVTITPEDIQRGMDLGMSFSGGGLGIKAYHGSPHDFSAFDLSKIGTGEGAQAYGHGLYMAGNEATAKSYKGAGPEASRQRDIINGQLSSVAREMDQVGYGDPTLRAKYNDLLAKRDNLGHMYEVNINADPEHFLDWDKPLSEQSQSVKDAAQKLFPQGRTSWGFEPKTGENVVRAISGEMARRSGRPITSDPIAGANALREAGIPGIKYLDQGSRATGEGSYNYAVFNDKLIDIVKKYGLAGLLGSGILATDRNQQ